MKLLTEELIEKFEKVNVQVLQLSDTEENYTKMFMPSKSFKDGVNSVKAQDYECVYKSKEYYCDLNNKADTCELLENLFYKYNEGDKPDGYKGHSLSVSDVLILECEGMSKAYYCDRVGFATLPETFLEEWKKDIKSEFASMSKVEKEALIEGVEMALDYQDKVDKDTMKLYEMAIEERQKEQEEPDICD